MNIYFSNIPLIKDKLGKLQNLYLTLLKRIIQNWRISFLVIDAPKTLFFFFYEKMHPKLGL